MSNLGERRKILVLLIILVSIGYAAALYFDQKYSRLLWWDEVGGCARYMVASTRSMMKLLVEPGDVVAGPCRSRLEGQR
jgi:hypothetical protein